MGVTGLWRLIEPAGTPVPVETLENKVLAVDISIWLHQMVKGYQDAKGAPLPNAHLMGLFQRLCKLLYFRIKPVFIFDGAFPELKKETIAKRQDHKAKYNSESERLKREIALLLGKKTAIGALLGKQIPQKKNTPAENNDDLFKLPALPEKKDETESESEDEEDSSTSSVDLHSVDLESEKFKNMPAKEKYDMLVELKETRKMNSWGKLDTLPKKSENFSDFQMQRLLKRRKLQECLEETEKEMGEGGMSLNELESLLNEEGIDTKIESLPNRRIASNDTTRYLLISNVRQALADAKKKKELEALKQTEIKPVENVQEDVKIAKTDELEDDLQKAIKMSLECVDDIHDTSAGTSKTDESWTSNLTDTEYSDTEYEEDGFEQPDMTSAKAYIMQYSDFTHRAINELVVSKQKNKNKNIKSTVDQILYDLGQEKSVILDKVEVSSTEEETSPITDETTNKTDIVEINTKKKSNKTHTNIGDDLLQSSVICIEENNKTIISIDTSSDEESVYSEKPNIESKIIVTMTSSTITQPVNTDEINKQDLGNEKAKTINNCTESHNKDTTSGHSDTSEDEFEEVIESGSSIKQPVIQLRLDMNEDIKEDIFADIFEIGSEVKQSPTTIFKDMSVEKTENQIGVDMDLKVETNQISKTCYVDSKTTDHISEIDIHNESIEIPKQISPLKDLQQDESPATVTKSTESDNIKIKEHLNSVVTEIENQEQDLLQEKGRLDRIGRNITEQMTKEAQELLQLFGVPYIIAPMEAEAQCAFLESVHLTDGTITDDSDIWLFGGKTVYKNFFNQKKHVLQFLNERIEKSFNLSREQLILLALLVGSDYTSGVNGVGPVTALEILASFPFNKKRLSDTHKQAQYEEIVTGLLEFKKWVRAGKRTSNISLKKKLKNINVADDFPSVRVVQAYLEPNVEKSKEKFTWGELDITLLRDYTKTKFGWSQNKLDEIIKPVIKRLQDRKSQRTVHDYFKPKMNFKSLENQMSKRVMAAVQMMEPDNPLKDTDMEEEKQKPPRKRKKNVEKSGESGPSKAKLKKEIDIKEIVKLCPINDDEKGFDITVRKTQTSQEIIPQRERDKQNILQNKLKAIEAFRKSKIDRFTKKKTRRLPQPKDTAELSESSDTN